MLTFVKRRLNKNQFTSLFLSIFELVKQTRLSRVKMTNRPLVTLLMEIAGAAAIAAQNRNESIKN